MVTCIKKTPLYTFLLFLLSTNYISDTLGAPGDASGAEFLVNTYITSGQKNSSIAMDSSGNFVVSWNSSEQDGNYEGVFAQRFKPDGTATGTEFQVNTEASSSQAFPSVAMDADGDFVIAWESAMQDGDSNGIFAQRYNADGTTNGTEFQVNTVTTSNQSNPSVTMDADGDFVVAWESYDGFGSGIYAQLYSNDGNTTGAEILVNTYTAGSQSNPSVAMDANGDFIVAWQSFVQDGSNMGVYAQRYLASGTETGSEFRVNTDTHYDQSDPSVAMGSDGDFVVTWTSLNTVQDGSFQGIYAQRYDKSGTASGSEFRVNTETFSHQVEPAVAMDSDGDFVVSWSSYQDGDSFGVYAQRYEGAGNFAVGTVDLTIVVTDNTDPIVNGTELTYTIITTNNGTGMALDLKLSAQLPVGLGYVSHNGGDWSCIEINNHVSCNLPILAAGANNMVTVTASAMGADGVTSQTVSVFAAQTDANPNDNTDTETTTIKASEVTPSNTVAPPAGGSGSLDLLGLLLTISLALRRRLIHF